MGHHTCKTFVQQFKSALRCTTPQGAEWWMENEVAHFVKHHNKTPEEAIAHIKSNLGYMAGYHNHETAQKIHRLFGAVHPVFGTSTYHQDGSPERALEIGKKAGQEGK